MSRSQYFTHVIVSAAEKSGASQEDLNSFKSAHDLIKGLNRSVPKLLSNVIPQLEEELKVSRQNFMRFSQSNFSYINLS